MSDQVTVTRNDVAIPLSNYKIVKGPNKDKEYPAPTVSVEGLDNFLKWFGADNVTNILQTYVKRVFQTLFIDAIDETTGQVNMEKFLLEAKDFTSSGLKMAEILAKLDELQAEMGGIIANMIDPTTGAPDPVKLGEIQKLNASILAYKEMKEARSRKKAETEPEAAVAVA